MKKIIQKFVSTIMVFMMGVGMIAPAIQAAPAYATGPGTTFGDAAILTDCYAQGEGSQDGGGIWCVFKLVVNVLSVLVGILGIIGIVVVGIQYLTAGGNEERVRKSKRRLLEIVIGLVAYALGYAFLSWLLPEYGVQGSNNGGSTSQATYTTISLLAASIGA